MGDEKQAELQQQLQLSEQQKEELRKIQREVRALENTPTETMLAEVPRQVASLEYVCAYLTGLTKNLEKYCNSVISATLKSDENDEGVPMRPLCPLASRLRTCVHRVETACEDIESLMERMEL